MKILKLGNHQSFGRWINRPNLETSVAVPVAAKAKDGARRKEPHLPAVAVPQSAMYPITTAMGTSSCLSPPPNGTHQQ